MMGLDPLWKDVAVTLARAHGLERLTVTIEPVTGPQFLGRIEMTFLGPKDFGSQLVISRDCFDLDPLGFVKRSIRHARRDWIKWLEARALA